MLWDSLAQACRAPATAPAPALWAALAAHVARWGHRPALAAAWRPAALALARGTLVRAPR